jgi:CheY-like chemotaxis protein
LATARELVPNLIRLDMWLTKLGGLGVLRALKRDPQTAVIPVIVLTGLGATNEPKLKKERATARFHKIGLALTGQFPTHCFTLSRTCWASKKGKDLWPKSQPRPNRWRAAHSAAVQDGVNFLEQRTSIDWFRQELSLRYQPGREGSQVAGVSRHE